MLLGPRRGCIVSGICSLGRSGLYAASVTGVCAWFEKSRLVRMKNVK
jgi:hypothetical protein